MSTRAQSKGGRPTNQEIAAKKAAQAKLERYTRQESKRADKIQIDQKIVQRVWMIAVGLAFLASAIISFNGITGVAKFVGLSVDWQRGLFFFFIEFLYLIFLVAYLVLASQPVDEETGKPVSKWGALVGMWFFAGVSIYSNFIHTGIYNNWDFASIETWTGLVLSVSAPIAIVSSSKLASRVIFARAISVSV